MYWIKTVSVCNFVVPGIETGTYFFRIRWSCLAVLKPH
jgi:hypothetical protein